MPAVYEDLDFIEKQFEAAQAGEEPDLKVKGAISLPRYFFSAGSYRATVKNWVNTYNTNRPTVIQLSLIHI